jgi:hypothetical protein
MPTSSIARPSKIYPNWDFWFENKPSGNPGGKVVCPKVLVIVVCVMERAIIATLSFESVVSAAIHTGWVKKFWPNF